MCNEAQVVARVVFEQTDTNALTRLAKEHSSPCAVYVCRAGCACQQARRVMLAARGRKHQHHQDVAASPTPGIYPTRTRRPYIERRPASAGQGLVGPLSLFCSPTACCDVTAALFRRQCERDDTVRVRTMDVNSPATRIVALTTQGEEVFSEPARQLATCRWTRSNSLLTSSTAEDGEPKSSPFPFCRRQHTTTAHIHI